MNPFDDTTTTTPIVFNPGDDENRNSFGRGEAEKSFSDSLLLPSTFSDVNAAADGDVALPVESSWHFLGELPYRRVSLYKDVHWSNAPVPKNVSTDDEGELEKKWNSTILVGNGGLAAYPPAYISAVELLDVDTRAYLYTATTTLVAACPYGGPIAVVTVPKVQSALSSSHFQSAYIRIMTNSRKIIAMIAFPPPNDGKHTPADIISIGFTTRAVLLIVTRDSTCFTYSVKGDMLLPPFPVLPPPSTTTDVELIRVAFYEAGVAVLSETMSSALVEILDEFDDPMYIETSSASRRITSSSAQKRQQLDSTSHIALVTPLPTAALCNQNVYTFCAIAVLSRNFTMSRRPEVFLATTDHSVIVIDTSLSEKNIVDVECRSRIDSPIVQMAFAPNGRFLACFTSSQTLTVISTSFETKVLDFDTSEGSSDAPEQMVWCGDDSVVLHWRNLGVLLVGPYGDWLRFSYNNIDELNNDSSLLCLVGEIDCCRVISDRGVVELIQRVPPETASLLRIGSIEPSAMLLDAWDAFEKGSPAADESARAITKTGLTDVAIDICIDAASREFDIPTQKRLLRAASYGMNFTNKEQEASILGGDISSTAAIIEQEDDEYKEGEGKVDNHGIPSSTTQTNERPTASAKSFVSSSKKLRVLNTLRNPDVGLALTSSQYDEITSTGVIARLVAIGRPALAASVSKYLDLDRKVQAFSKAARAAAFLVASTNSTAAANMSDAQIAEACVQMLDDNNNSSKATTTRGVYASVALSAFQAGRPGVASLLLTLESSPTEKVPALIAIGAYADAAAVAASARDADLIFSSVMEFEQSCCSETSADQNNAARSKFVSTIVQKFPKEASDTLKLYYASMSDIKALNHLLFLSQNFLDAGSYISKRVFGNINVSDLEAVSLLKEGSRIYGLGKDCTFQKSCTDDYIELLAEQERLRNVYGPRVVPKTSSISQTIEAILCYAAEDPNQASRLASEAERLCKKFRLAEKRIWFIKVDAFAKTGQWKALRTLGDSRAKSPIGFKPFALALLRGKQPVNDAVRYIDRCTQPEERYLLFCEAKVWKKALDEALQLKDPERIMNVRSLCNDNEMQQLCDRLALQLE